MIMHHGRSGRRVRSIFVSDLHLGCRHSQADDFLAFLNRYTPEQLYLVGDFIDGWKLRRRWHWKPVYSQILHRLLELSRGGTPIRYAAGNHDDFLRDFLDHFELFEIDDQFIHIGADQRRYLVIHADRFDRVECGAKWLSVFSSYLYDALLSANWLLNRFRGNPQGAYHLSARVKGRIKCLVQLFSEFESLLSDAASKNNCQGVICGHIHSPKIQQTDELAYCNTGDWVENRTALVEHFDGSMEIIHFDGTPGDRLEPLPSPAKTEPFKSETQTEPSGRTLLRESLETVCSE